VAAEQIPKERNGPFHSVRVVEGIVVFCDRPIPTGVGPALLTSREPNAQ
jgi:hypothetical protein